MSLLMVILLFDVPRRYTPRCYVCLLRSHERAYAQLRANI